MPDNPYAGLSVAELEAKLVEVQAVGAELETELAEVKQRQMTVAAHRNDILGRLRVMKKMGGMSPEDRRLVQNIAAEGVPSGQDVGTPGG